MSNFLHKKLLPTAAFGLLAVSSGVANALTLTDGNAQFVVDLAGGGVTGFTVDGTDHFWEQDFLYDITATAGKSGRFEEIGMFDDGGGFMGTPTQSLSGTNGVTLTYVLEDVTIDVSFLLTGGLAGTNDAMVVETYQITNTSADTLSLNLFAYTDIDLGGTFQSNGNDQGEVLTDTAIPFTAYRQFDTDLNLQMVARTTTSDGVDQPSNWMVGIGEDAQGNVLNTVKNQLYDTTNTVFDNSVETGPIDLQMAAAFVRDLAANGGTFTYSHSLELSDISTIPVPAAAWLFGSGLLGLVGVARRKSA